MQIDHGQGQAPSYLNTDNTDNVSDNTDIVLLFTKTFRILYIPSL